MKIMTRRCAWVFAGLAAGLLAAFVLNVCTGSTDISFSRAFSILFMGGGTEVERGVIFDIRLPRTLLAMILGGAIAVSGFLLQTFFSNPVAGPYILGISSGAKMAVAIEMILFVGKTGRSSSLLMVLAAFAGSLAATGIIIIVARYVRGTAALLAAGIMIGYICSAVTDFLVTFADDSNIVNLRGWSQGSFSGADMSSVQASLVIVGASMVLTILFSKPISAFRMGESYARSMGVRVGRFRVILILLSSVLSACATAFAGPVAFVGIAVPCLMRGLLASSEPLVLIPSSFLGGALLCAASDLIARCAFAPTELNISTVTSLFGAPVVLVMLMRKNRGK